MRRVMHLHGMPGGLDRHLLLKVAVYFSTCLPAC